MQLETERLTLRQLVQSDYDALCKILQDEQVMYAYNGSFSDAEVQDWLERQCARYTKSGTGLLAVVLKSSGEMIGQCGLLWQTPIDKQELEIGYLLQKAHWHKGYATEAALACKHHAFEVMKQDRVISMIRETNLPSQQVAKRLGMTIVDRFVEHYRGVDMPHLIFAVNR